MADHVVKAILVDLLEATFSSCHFYWVDNIDDPGLLQPERNQLADRGA